MTQLRALEKAVSGPSVSIVRKSIRARHKEEKRRAGKLNFEKSKKKKKKKK